MHVVNVPVGDVHGFTFKPGTQGWVSLSPPEMLDEVLAPSEGLRRVLAHAAVVRGTPQMRVTMEQIFAEFAGRHFGQRAYPARLVGQRRSALWRASSSARSRARRRGRIPTCSGASRRCLNSIFWHAGRVSDYASALSVTSTHLNRVTRAATGDTASHLILNRMIREARRNLVYTNMPIATIAYALGFDDPAYFSRVYAAATGLSPRGFRTQLHVDEA